MIIKDIIIFRPDVHTDYHGGLWTLWKKDILNSDFNYDQLSTFRKHILCCIPGDFKFWK